MRGVDGLIAAAKDIDALAERVRVLELELDDVGKVLRAKKPPELLTLPDAGERLGLTVGQIQWRLRFRYQNGLIESGAVVEDPLRIDPDKWVEWERRKDRRK